MLTYCGTCDERRPVLHLIWCAFCEEYHDYGTTAAELGVEDDQRLRFCPACGSVLSEISGPEDEDDEDDDDDVLPEESDATRTAPA